MCDLFLLHALSLITKKKTWEIQSRNYLSFVLKSIALILLHIFRSVHYTPITVIYTKFAQFYYIYNNIIKTANCYVFRVLLVHHWALW